eukprot:scaffold7850_cov372-Pinguiococcus_pyrenoidosus.AAC.2
MFDILTDFPDSSVALQELKLALQRARFQGQLVSCLREALERRLLHPGASTNQVIDVYISTVKSLRLLDPSDQLLDIVADPIRKYLRQRQDTVRCIVESLVDASGGDLFAELQRGTQGQQPPGKEDGVWTPPTWEADVTTSPWSGSDILTLFVSIYGSKKLFVEEYRAMLADKLLSDQYTDADQVVTNIELLKLRFGEDSLVDCEIMIRDVEESRRLNANILGTVKEQHPDYEVNATILSHLYWPPLRRQEMELHPRISDALERYREEYSVMKNPRTLEWYADLGSVEVELEFDDGSERAYDVSPLDATVILHFEGARRSWKASELAAEANLGVDQVQRALVDWRARGALEENSAGPESVFTILASPREGDASNLSDGQSDRYIAKETKSAEDEEILSSYIYGMLKNLKSLPLRRIHQLLTTYMQGKPTEAWTTLDVHAQFLTYLLFFFCA